MIFVLDCIESKGKDKIDVVMERNEGEGLASIFFSKSFLSSSPLADSPSFLLMVDYHESTRFFIASSESTQKM